MGAAGTSWAHWGETMQHLLDQVKRVVRDSDAFVLGKIALSGDAAPRLFTIEYARAGTPLGLRRRIPMYVHAEPAVLASFIFSDLMEPSGRIEEYGWWTNARLWWGDQEEQ